MEEDIKYLEDLLAVAKMLLTTSQKATIQEREIQAIENLIKGYKDLEEYKKYAELTKISCCTAQNCEALNNAIRQGIENQKLREHVKELEEKVQDKTYKFLCDNPYIDTFDVREVIMKDKVREKIEQDTYTNEHTILGGRRSGKTLEYGIRLGRIQMCEELLQEGEK